jgi:isopentenyl-diphosphate delta-isomerase
MQKREGIILLDSSHHPVGSAEKWTVHEYGLLHRAFSVFLVDGKGRVLLQRRSREKYHSAGLWANSCCGHPRPGERTNAAARRRVREELGATARVRYGFRAQYCTELPNGLTENEVVDVFFGPAPEATAPDPTEVAAIEWKTVNELAADITRRPRRYAYWLRFYMKNHLAAIRRGVASVRGKRNSVAGSK